VKFVIPVLLYGYLYYVTEHFEIDNKRFKARRAFVFSVLCELSEILVKQNVWSGQKKS